MPSSPPSADNEGMRILNAVWLLLPLVALGSVAAACGDDGAKAREEALRAAVAALKPEGAEMSEAEIGTCEGGGPGPNCIGVNFFFPSEDAYNAKHRRAVLQAKADAEGWSYLAASVNRDGETALLYYQRGEQYLTVLLVADRTRSGCVPSTLRNERGGLITSACIDRLWIERIPPLGIELAR
jgi:hypothetical protein